jgi:hypothetical protein
MLVGIYNYFVYPWSVDLPSHLSQPAGSFLSMDHGSIILERLGDFKT